MAFDGSIRNQQNPHNPPDFDALCCSAGYAAQEAYVLLMAAFFAEGAARSATLARRAIDHFDELEPLVAQLRARLAKPNPFGGPR